MKTGLLIEKITKSVIEYFLDFKLRMSFQMKLQTSDGVIFSVDAATVKQMVTIQTMLDQEDENSNEVIPVPTVSAQILEKIIQWVEYQNIDHEKKEQNTWCIEYFNLELRKKFEIIIAADYLEIHSLLNEACRTLIINNRWDIIEDTARCFLYAKVLILLEGYERDHGYDLIVAISSDKHLKYFDCKVTSKRYIFILSILKF